MRRLTILLLFAFATVTRAATVGVTVVVDVAPVTGVVDSCNTKEVRMVGSGVNKGKYYCCDTTPGARSWSLCSATGGGGATPGGGAQDIQINDGAGALAAVPGFKGDPANGAVTTKILNKARVMTGYATGAGTTGSPYVGWWTGLAANTVHRFPAGYYGVIEGPTGTSITIPDGAKIACDPGAVFTYTSARATSDEAMFVIPTTSNDVTVEGCKFQTTVTVPPDGLSSGGGGKGFFYVGEQGGTTGPSRTVFRNNVFGVVPYQVSTIFMSSVDVFSALGIVFENNSFDTAAANIALWDGYAAIQQDVVIQNNRFSFSQAPSVASGMGGAINVGSGGEADGTHPTVRRLTIQGNTFHNTNTGVLLETGGTDITIEGNVKTHTSAVLNSDHLIQMSYDRGGATDPPNAYVLHNVHILNNSCSDTSGHTSQSCGIAVQGCDDCEVSGNTLSAGSVVSNTWIYLQTGNSNVRVKNNTITRFAPYLNPGAGNTAGVVVFGWSGLSTKQISISGNKATDVGRGAVWVDANGGTMDQISIENNTLYTTSAYTGAGYTPDYVVNVASGATNVTATGNVALGATPTGGAVSSYVTAPGQNYTPTAGWTGVAAGTLGGTGSTFTGASSGSLLANVAAVNPGVANSTTYNGTGIISEGATGGLDANEGTITFPDWAADRAIAFQDWPGTICVGGGTGCAPSGTWANRPISNPVPATGTLYVVTDDASVGACTGGAAAQSLCRWSGSAWVSLGDGGSGSAPAAGNGIDVSGSTVSVRYGDDLTTQTPALGARECRFTTNGGTGNGGLICEGTVAGDNRQSYLSIPAPLSGDGTIVLPVAGSGATVNIPAKEVAGTWSAKQTWGAVAHEHSGAETHTGAETFAGAATWNGRNFSDAYTDIATGLAALPSTDGELKVDPAENDSTTFVNTNPATTTTGKRGAIVIDERDGGVRWLTSRDQYGLDVEDQAAVPFVMQPRFDDPTHDHRDADANGSLDTNATHEWTTVLDEGYCSVSGTPTSGIHCTQDSDCLNDASHCATCVGGEECIMYSANSGCTANTVPYACCTGVGTGSGAGLCAGATDENKNIPIGSSTWGSFNHCSTTTTQHCYQDSQCPGSETCVFVNKRYWYNGSCNALNGSIATPKGICPGPPIFQVRGPQHAGSGNDQKPVFSVGSAGAALYAPEHPNIYWNSWLTAFRNDMGNGDLTKANTPMYSLSDVGFFADGTSFVGAVGNWPRFSNHVYQLANVWTQQDIDYKYPPVVVESTTTAGANWETGPLLSVIDQTGGRTGESGGFYYHSSPHCSTDLKRYCTGDADCTGAGGACVDNAALTFSGASKSRGLQALTVFANSVLFLGSKQESAPSLATDQRIVFGGTTLNDANVVSLGLVADPTGARSINLPDASGTVCLDTTCGGGSGYTTVKDETSALTARSTVAFLGAGVSCSDSGTQTECTIGGGGSTSFSAAGDTGTPQTISDTNTLSILGGTNGVDTVAGATDTVTLNIDQSEMTANGVLGGTMDNPSLDADSVGASQIATGAVDVSTTDVTGDLPFSKLTPAAAASKLLGRGSASGGGDYEEITLGTNLSMSGTTLNATGGSAAVVGSYAGQFGYATRHQEDLDNNAATDAQPFVAVGSRVSIASSDANDSGLVWLPKYDYWLLVNNGNSGKILSADLTSTIASFTFASCGNCDFEAATITDPSGDYFYTGMERSVTQNVMEWKVSDALGGGAINPTKEWDLNDSWCADNTANNAMYEGFTFVPDVRYGPTYYTSIPRGYFIAMCQTSPYNSYKFVLDTNSGGTATTPTAIATMSGTPCSQDATAGFDLTYDWLTGLLWYSSGTQVSVINTDWTCQQSAMSINGPSGCVDNEGLGVGAKYIAVTDDDGDGTCAASNTISRWTRPRMTEKVPTAAVDTNTEQIASTAFVVGQGYLKSANVDSLAELDTQIGITGTPSASTYWRGDNSWATIAAGGDVLGPTTSADNTVARFNGTDNKTIQSSAVTIADEGATTAVTIAVTGTDPVLTAGNATFDFSTPITGTSFTADAGGTVAVTSGCTVGTTVDCPAVATGGGSLELKEDSDGGASKFILTLGASNLSTDITCTIDANGRMPDACLDTALARLAAPALTGNPTSATTPSADDNDTSIANTAFVQQEINGAGGRSLSAASGSVSADAELYTRVESIAILAPATTDSGVVQVLFPTVVTITRIACSTDTGTVDIQFDERAAATPNTAGQDVMTAALQCTSTQAATTTFGGAGGASVAARVPLNLDIDAVASTPGKLRIFVEYTVDD